MKDTETLRRRIGDILNRNTEPRFLRLALTKLAVLEQVYWEQRRQGVTEEECRLLAAMHADPELRRKVMKILALDGKGAVRHAAGKV